MYFFNPIQMSSMRFFPNFFPKYLINFEFPLFLFLIFIIFFTIVKRGRIWVAPSLFQMSRGRRFLFKHAKFLNNSVPQMIRLYSPVCLETSLSQINKIKK
jgi:hypothetical protein